MKKAFTILALLLFNICLFAQKNFSDGYIVTLKNDTVTGKIKDQFTFFSMTKKIEFIDSTGKKTTMFPNEINGYSKADVANYLSIDINNEKDFAKIVKDGNITLLTYTQQTANTFMGPSQYITYFLYNRLTHKTQRVIQLNFKESMAEYFSDYPELHKMILNKELRYNDLEIIVEKYNKWKQIVK